MGNPRLGNPSVLTPLQSASGDDLRNGIPEAANSTAVFAFLSLEIQAKLGKDFLGKIPLDQMEGYCLATVENGHPTADMLYQLITNFLQAYSNPETTEDALKALDFLGYQADKSRS